MLAVELLTRGVVGREEEAGFAASIFSISPKSFSSSSSFELAGLGAGLEVGFVAGAGCSSLPSVSSSARRSSALRAMAVGLRSVMLIDV